MILADNITILKIRYPNVWTAINQISMDSTGYTIEQSKNGMNTIVHKSDSRPSYIHSKYDPQDEAERFISQFEDQIDFKDKHVIIFGAGLGYHIEVLLKKYPKLSISLYEPNLELFKIIASQENFQETPWNRLKNLYVECNAQDRALHIQQFVESIFDKVQLIVWPGYEKLFTDELRTFTQEFQASIINRRQGLVTNFAFEKRWTINSMMNLAKTSKSPNILQDFPQGVFNNKPALLVAAGPSLNEEIEHIRKIKDDGLAYIFSVGSAINTLIKNGIIPDATCTYDPQDINYRVLSILNEQGINDVPIIYGSSVGFETIKDYPGPILHMITSQDTVASLFLRKQSGNELKSVQDAPSIAVIAIQMLHSIGCNPVILVGQNLAYLNEQYYATGADSHNGKFAPPQNSPLITDVYGNSVKTNNSLLLMRKQMEQYIKLYPREYINTTKGGAHIEGSIFTPLVELIESRLNESVVTPQWYESDKGDHYDTEYIRMQCLLIEEEFEAFPRLLERGFNLLAEITKKKASNKLELEKAFPKFDSVFKKIKKNKYYSNILAPMNRISLKQLENSITAVRFEKDLAIKSERVVTIFNKYLLECKGDTLLLEPIVRHMLQQLRT